MRKIGKIAVFVLLPFFLTRNDAQATETTVINFACDGKISAGNATPEPMNNLGSEDASS
jgi:hypothetical protein